MSPSGDGWFGRPILRPAKEPPLPQIQHPAGHPRERARYRSAYFLDALHRATLGRGLALRAVDAERAFQTDPAHRAGEPTFVRLSLLRSSAPARIAEEVAGTAEERGSCTRWAISLIYGVMVIRMEKTSPQRPGDELRGANSINVRWSSSPDQAGGASTSGRLSDGV